MCSENTVRGEKEGRRKRTDSEKKAGYGLAGREKDELFGAFTPSQRTTTSLKLTGRPIKKTEIKASSALSFPSLRMLSQAL